MEAEEDSDMEEPLAHVKEEENADTFEKTSKKPSKKTRDADSTDSTDTLDNESTAQKSQNSHIQKSSKTIDETKSAVKLPKDKKDVKK